MYGFAPADLQPDLLHGRLELVPLFGLRNDVRLRPDHLDAESVQHTLTAQFHGHVQAGLASERRKEGVRPLFLDHLGDHLPRQRLDVGPRRGRGIGHDRRGVRIDQDHFIALLAERLAGLGPRIVELAGLADDNGSRSDQKDLVDVGSLGHGLFSDVGSMTIPLPVAHGQDAASRRVEADDSQRAASRRTIGL